MTDEDRRQETEEKQAEQAEVEESSAETAQVDKPAEQEAEQEEAKAEQRAEQGEVEAKAAEEQSRTEEGEVREAGPVSVDEVGEDKEQEEQEPEQEDPLEKLRAENVKLREQLLRKAADLDNFRKRTRRELQEARKMAQADLLKELLPVFDNLERASSHADQAEDAKAVAEGVKLVLKQFVDTLKKLGIERVPSVGSAFDPNVHEAIQQIESSDFEPGTVAAEVLGGYVWGDRLIRAAMVVVAKAPAVQPAEGSSGIEEPAEVVEAQAEDSAEESGEEKEGEKSTSEEEQQQSSEAEEEKKED